MHAPTTTPSAARRAADKLFAPRPQHDDDPAVRLPRVAEARSRDIAARMRLGLAIVDHDAIRRGGYAADITRDEFAAAPRRGRGRRQ